jgi:hypothetical protein
MSGSYFDPNWTTKVTVPVKRVGERWEFFYGGDVPVKEGTLGELTLSADQLTDEKFRQRVTQELTVKILDEGTELLVALSDRDINGRLAGKWPEPSPMDVPPGTTRFECVKLGALRKKVGEPLPHVTLEPGGLWLKLKGLERCELTGSSVQMPAGFDPPSATSLNHALTMLSQAFEKHRISNTGNVYTRVFYRDRDAHWYPLDDLRTGVLAEGERTLLGDLWAQVEKVLGWRPVPPKKKGK